MISLCLSPKILSSIIHHTVVNKGYKKICCIFEPAGSVPSLSSPLSSLSLHLQSIPRQPLLPPPPHPSHYSLGSYHTKTCWSLSGFPYWFVINIQLTRLIITGQHPIRQRVSRGLGLCLWRPCHWWKWGASTWVFLSLI